MIPIRRHLEYASGYLTLGMLNEASDELEMIQGDAKLSADVMRLRISLYHQAEHWDLLEAVAMQLTRLSPKEEQGWISWAFATRRLRSLPEAREVLLKAETILGDTCSTLHFNLACYACQLGEMEEAKRRLETACKMHSEYKAIALEDPDLKPMWDKLGE
jgi:tetratricopeptide (TPR) repeat protein